MINVQRSWSASAHMVPDRRRNVARSTLFSMRLVSVTIAKNEADIIEPFVRHHLQFFDRMLMVNHDSTDDTGEILRSLVAEGLPITIFEDKALAYMQGPRTTTLARQAVSAWGASYVFPLDADEFVKAPSRTTLQQAVASVPGNLLGALVWQNYLLPERDAPDAADRIDPLARMTERAKVEPVVEQKIVLSAAALRDPSWEISPGNHYLTRLDGSSAVAAMRKLEGLALAHFPLRSAEQVQRKALLGWLSYRLQNPKDIPPLDSTTANAQFWHLREMIREVVKDSHFSNARIREMTWRYYVAKTRDVTANSAIETLHDPLPIAYALRYTSRNSGSAIAGVARWTDRLLTHLGSQM